MALLPAAPSRKLKLFAAARPNYSDYSGPPDGDYVRYVEGLVAWSQQEQERQRLKALGEKGREKSSALPDSSWGRAPAKSSVASVTADSYAQPGSVDTKVDRIKRKVQAQALKLQQQAADASKATPTAAAKKAATKTATKANMQASGVIFFAMLVAVAIFATDWLPVVIIGWVAFAVIRTVRAASRTGKS